VREREKKKKKKKKMKFVKISTDTCFPPFDDLSRVYAI